ncbi:CRISPR system precrRNA processing endoribonuclease RAMP protein Cas6 [Paenibacillus phoenicis]
MDRRDVIFSLTYLPLLIRLRCKEMAKLPAFLGSTLHGVVGWTLLNNREVYEYLFENRRLGGAKQDIVNPYMIEPPRSRSVYHPGDELCFRFVLFGEAIRYAEEVVTSMVKAAFFGIGAERKQFELLDILHAEHLYPIWQQGHSYRDSMAAVNIETVAVPEPASWCSVHLLTPVRIRRGGELVQNINFPTIIRGATRRIQALTERYGGYIDQAKAEEAIAFSKNIRELSSGLYLNEMHRYSNRKSESLDWSGMLGAITFAGELDPFTPWLKAARILHIGRNTTFGCGQLDVIFR